MSEPDQEEGFLARWSQRKSVAQTPEPELKVADVDLAAVATPEAEPPPEVDLASLPKIEEMTSTTDITGFLRKGVPEELRNAALRQSWALDPAIRNYVSPALEYAYDWNTPGGVPGNSEIAAGTDIAKMILQIMGNSDNNDEPTTSSPAEHESGGQPVPVEQDPACDPATLPVRVSDSGHPAVPSLDPDAVAAEAERLHLSHREDIAAPQQTLRRHGGAKPTT